MITSDEVFDRLSNANPHPDISDLVPTSAQFTAFLRELEGEPVETITRPPEPDQKPVRGGLLVAAGAFALVLIVIGAMWLLGDETTVDAPADTTVATTAAPTTTAPAVEDEAAPAVSPSTQAALDEMVNAYNDGDIEAYAALFDPGVVIALGDEAGRVSPYGRGFGTGDIPRELLRHLEEVQWEIGMETTLSLNDCTEEAPAVACTAHYSDFYIEAMNGGYDTHLELQVLDGQIVSYRETAIDGETIDHLDGALVAWADKEHGIDFGTGKAELRPELVVPWQVFGRLYLDSTGRQVEDAPFAPGVDLEDLAVAVKLGNALDRGPDEWMSMLVDEEYTYTLNQLSFTLDAREHAEGAAWFGETMKLSSCRPAPEGRLSCVYVTEDDFTRASGLGPISGTWSFAVVGDQVADVRFPVESMRAHGAEVTLFVAWAAEAHPDIEIAVIDGEIPRFAPGEQNAEAILALLEEYATHLGN